jgi:hypothetical protein
MVSIIKRWVVRKNGYKDDVMRPFVRIVALLLFSAIFPHFAVADWQYTRWGMTADQIVAASNGAAKKLAGTEQEAKSGATFTALAVGTFKTGPFDFAVSFRADKGGNTLKTVRLTLNNRYHTWIFQMPFRRSTEEARFFPRKEMARSSASVGKRLPRQ